MGAWGLFWTGLRPSTSGSASDLSFLVSQAMDLQSKIMKRVPLEQPEMILSQKQLAASICIQCGEQYLAEKEYAKTEQSYKNALSYSPTDNKVGPSEWGGVPHGGSCCSSRGMTPRGAP